MVSPEFRVHAVGVEHPDRERRPDLVRGIEQIHGYQRQRLLVELDGDLETRKRA